MVETSHDQFEEQGAAPLEHAADEHPGPRQYVIVALVLAVVTGLEVGLYCVKNLPNAVLIGSLMVLMVIKFELVALWFMFLWFDSRV